MARFVSHGPCPNCGSRDNLGRYDDGSAHCFGGCGYFEKATHAPRRDYQQKVEEDVSTPKIPEDADHDFSQEAVEWLAKYSVGLPEAIKRGVLWSNYRQQLIFDMENVWQARNFNKDAAAKRKYFTAGDVNDHLPIYQAGSKDQDSGLLVIVEDCVSALKIARQSDSMPLLGSHLSLPKLNRIARLYEALIVWLDGNKYREAQAIARRAQLLGMKSRAVYTELDPKEYSDNQIKGLIQ